MKHFFGQLLFAAFIAGTCLCSCAEKNFDNAVDEDADAGGIYMTLTLDMSATTKSSTDSGDDNDYGSSDADEDTEVGSDSENAVNSVLVVLYKDEITYASQITYSNSSNSTVTAVFESQDLKDMAGEEVKVYVICNVETDYVFKSLDDTYQLTSASDGTPWATSEFYMANAKVQNAITLASDLTPYNSEENAYDLGTVYVERCCARFDYADASEDSDNTYAVETYNEDNGYFLPSISSTTEEFTYRSMTTPSYTVNIVLEELALCNLSKEFYMIRRVIAGEDSDGDEVNDTYGSEASAVYCGTETSSNFVMDTDWNYKSSYDGADYATDNFYYTLSSFDDLEFTSISDITSDDNWTNNTNSYDYKVWRYATENTIPSVDKQVQGLSTGVVFKGKIELDENSTSPYAYAFSEDNTSDLFSFNNCLWGTWEDVKLYAEVVTDSNTPQFPAIYVAYNSVLAYLEDKDLEGTADNICEAAINEGFTVYSYDSEDGCYPVYYYYWNRHNDNDQSSVMGPMEFAVVRNNVYKLAVTNISGYGYGVDEDGEPDVPDPGEDDETDDVYFRVSLEILPWVVRVNNITL